MSRCLQPFEVSTEPLDCVGIWFLTFGFWRYASGVCRCFIVTLCFVWRCVSWCCVVWRDVLLALCLFGVVFVWRCVCLAFRFIGVVFVSLSVWHALWLHVFGRRVLWHRVVGRRVFWHRM